MLLCKPLDFASHNIHLQVSVDVIVSNVPGCIDHVPEYFPLESLYNVHVTLFGVSQSWTPYVQTGFRITTLKGNKYVLRLSQLSFILFQMLANSFGMTRSSSGQYL